MNVVKHLSFDTGENVYSVVLTRDEAIRLAYGPLTYYTEAAVGVTATKLSTALVEAIAAPSCYSPTDDVLEDQ